MLQSSRIQYPGENSMFQTINAFYEAAQPFVDVFNTWVSKLRNAAHAYHICFKCSDSTEFESMRALLECESAFVYQSIISERRIAIVKLPRAIPTLLGDIWVLELSDQKPDGSQMSGFDHIEIYPTKVTLEVMAAMLIMCGVACEKKVRPHHTTYDVKLENGFIVRLENEALIDKIKRDEMKTESSDAKPHTLHRAAIDFPDPSQP